MSFRVRDAIRCLVFCCVLSCASACYSESTTLRVMTFNLWHGGDAGGQPMSQSVKVIQASKADIVGLQETRGFASEEQSRPNRGEAISKELGWNYYPQSGRRGILSRYPIDDSMKSEDGVYIELSSGFKLAFFNVHFPAAPYQPYQLLKIKYGEAPFVETESQAIEWANKSRGKQVDRVVRGLSQVLMSNTPAILTGDFNEPSFEDWTAQAVQAGKCPLAVRYPATAKVVEVGMRDVFRTVHKDEVASPGWTWTPTTKPNDPQDKHDRIDFVFASKHWQLINCQRVGEPGNADVVVSPWPSDHRAVVAELKLQNSIAEQ